MSKKTLDLIMEKEKEGKIVFRAFNSLMVGDIEEFLKQPVEGLLYDLNRLPETCATWIEADKVGWINNYASQIVIKTLYKKVEELEKENEKLREQIREE